jgi:glucokinase
MHPDYPSLLGDIGGTHARWAWLPGPGLAPCHVALRPCVADASLHASATAYLAAHGLGPPRSACIGVATHVSGDTVRMTNSPWVFSIAQLGRDLGVRRCLVINDFTALALSVDALTSEDLRAIGGGTPVAGAPLALLGPGTGLGVSGLLPGAGGWALSGEGGHVTLAPADDEESELLAVLRRRFGHVSAERVLSGPGLVNLYQALGALEGRPAAAPTPAAVVRSAIDGSDATSVRAVRLFAGFLGNVAGNLALTLGARGGVYLGGGLVPRLAGAFDERLFRQRFEDKGRFAAYLQPVPTWVITAATPALLGAARALEREAG